MSPTIDPNSNDTRRMEMLQQALSGTAGAKEVLLAMRAEELANEAAAEWVQLAQRYRVTSRANTRRTWLAGACASLALVAVFSLNQPVINHSARVQPQELVSNLPDSFGATASFEGAALESDSFARLNFEAN